MLCAVAAFSDWHSQGKHQTVHNTDPYLKLGGTGSVLLHVKHAGVDVSQTQQPLPQSA